MPGIQAQLPVTFPSAFVGKGSLNQEAHLKILVQNCITSEYLGKRGAWYPAEDEARIFPRAMEARDFCAAKKLKDAKIVVRFDSAEHDIEIPVS